MSNLPPGGGFYRSGETICCKCPNGHTWEAPAFFEMGGYFFVNEETGPVCPECGELDVDE
jgi:hypothetical protein